jgi:large subunit ribosomal protein L15
VKLNDLRPNPGSVRERKRVGRGMGSGSGKTSGRGHNGAKARGKVAPGFEGGQTPLHRRLPQTRGFKNLFKKVYSIVNIDVLAKLSEETITPDVMLENGIVKSLTNRIRVLGRGEIDKAITVQAHYFSKTAEEKIKSKGGTVEVI